MPSFKFNPKTGDLEVEQPISRITVDEAGLVKSEKTEVDGVITEFYEYQDGGTVTVKRLEGENQISGHKVTVSFKDDEDKPGYVHATYKMRT